MRSVAAHGGRWLWVPEEETDDSREGPVWGPACMPGVWMAYVNPGKPAGLDVGSSRPFRPVLSELAFLCVHAELSHASRLRRQPVTHVNVFHQPLCSWSQYRKLPLIKRWLVNRHFPVLHVGVWRVHLADMSVCFMSNQHCLHFIK